ncbi:hypothetical protein FOA52_004864 [Chlamydomonas sp. UWO 241]|nr:hypothetical protein FOA52_004864 [Chlamydomonas sp. UWO 241]
MELDLACCENIESVQPLKACAQLEFLYIDSYQWGLTELEELEAALPRLLIVDVDASDDEQLSDDEELSDDESGGASDDG